MHADGTAKLNLIRLGDSEATLAFSPDSKWIAYTNYEERTTLARVRVDGSDIAIIIQGLPDLHHPQWSPDGKWIAFTGYNDTGYDIYRVRPDGAELHNITLDAQMDEISSAWSPDGKWIVYTA